MDKTGKNFKIWGVRMSIIGDMVMSLVVLNALEKEFPGSYKYFHIAKKCAHAAPLFYNHPLIDRVVISDEDENFGENDAALAKECDIIINTKPPHHSQHDWPNYKNIFEETFWMTGLPMELYNKLSDDEKVPKLVKWFNVEKQPPKTIALWPCAGYGMDARRNPSQKWYHELIWQLGLEGYKIIQFGHPKDYEFKNEIKKRKSFAEEFKMEFGLPTPSRDFECLNHLPFFDQIKLSLGCDLVISTDSGSGLIFGAYEMPQISLLHDRFPGHVKNLLAFAPNNPKNHNFVGVGGADNIKIGEVITKVKEICP